MSDLREKVAQMFRDGPDGMYSAENLADAAIAVVLEEAARVAENNEGKARWQGEHIAAAIRALIPKESRGG